MSEIHLNHTNCNGSSGSTVSKVVSEYAQLATAVSKSTNDSNNSSHSKINSAHCADPVAVPTEVHQTLDHVLLHLESNPNCDRRSKTDCKLPNLTSYSEPELDCSGEDDVRADGILKIPLNSRLTKTSAVHVALPVVPVRKKSRRKNSNTFSLSTMIKHEMELDNGGSLSKSSDFGALSQNQMYSSLTITNDSIPNSDPAVFPQSSSHSDVSFGFRDSPSSFPTRDRSLDSHYQCKDCGKILATKSSLQRHEKAHSNPQAYICSECGDTFNFESNLKRHQVVHMEQKPFECTDCGRRFALPYYLKIHHKRGACVFNLKKDAKRKEFESLADKYKIPPTLSHHEMNGIPFKMPSSSSAHRVPTASPSGLRLPTSSPFSAVSGSLSKPQPRKPSTSVKPEPAMDMNYQFMESTPPPLSDGNHPHTSAEAADNKFNPNIAGRFNCPSCPASFSYKSNLIRHSKTHANDRQCVSCPICLVSFSSAANLKRHSVTHSAEKPHQCTICSSRFGLRDQLKRHMKIHSNERPYKCDVCPAAFAYSDHLKRHQRSHTGERPFVCSECDARFSLRHNLKAHQRTHERKSL